MSSIDFVIPWVDGNDEAWRAEKRRYDAMINGISMMDNSDMRYREWDNLKYWFRGVEKFAPWVNKVYFITNGQCPEWLNFSNEKLCFVKHSDFIPEEYLPTFSSHVIEINLHRIESLSEHFVYFNDDTFITRPITPELFYKNGLPVLPAILRPILPQRTSSVLLGHVYINMVAAINRNFDIRKSISENKKKWFSTKCYGLKNTIATRFLMNYPAFVGFYREHMPSPIVKSTMKKVWDAESELMTTTSSNRFRSSYDTSQYIFRYWELAAGTFEPGKIGALGECLHLRDGEKDKWLKICEHIKKQTYPMLCVNDSFNSNEDFEFAKKAVNEALHIILGEKSTFEL